MPLVIDEETTPSVRRIFEMRANGIGKQHIATILTKMKSQRLKQK